MKRFVLLTFFKSGCWWRWNGLKTNTCLVNSSKESILRRHFRHCELWYGRLLWSYPQQTSSVRINVMWLGSRQKTTPSLTDFRCWPAHPKDQTNPLSTWGRWCGEGQKLGQCLSSNMLSAWRLSVSQEETTIDQPMMLHVLELNWSASLRPHIMVVKRLWLRLHQERVCSYLQH